MATSMRRTEMIRLRILMNNSSIAQHVQYVDQIRVRSENEVRNQEYTIE